MPGLHRVALPSVRAALNVSLTFPDSLKWGGSDWKYPFNNDIGESNLSILCFRFFTEYCFSNGEQADALTARCCPTVVYFGSGWLDSGQPDPAVGGKPLDLRPLYAELAQSLRVIVYNGDVDGQVSTVSEL